jgi:isopenicillin-N N-acyltransferase like protein
MRRVKKAGLIAVAILFLLVSGLFIYVRVVASVEEPTPQNKALLEMDRISVSDNFFTIGNNWLKKSETNLYELYVEGDPFERGVAIGKLTRELVQYQEKVFNDQINRLVPSSIYRNFLKYFVGWFNRDLANHVPEEYKHEIFGIAKSASSDYDHIAPAYQRILNYHAAHDIGHALQNMSLVGCTSFATWANHSEDSTLLIGRNFDFYVGDEFARDKIIAFYNPSQGHKFMMVTFGGMTGVLSGMNDKGLTVTINAAKSDIPSASATPVSLVAREILQYATTIDEAFDIAQKRKMFVAESFLIGSARDGRAALIEKSPDSIELVEPTRNYIISTNHFQGKVLGSTQLNQDHVKTSASPYRYKRVEELLRKTGKSSVEKAAFILRNQRGLNDADIGLGNEKLINQLVAHHGIIFEPQKLRVWISTAPWQLGKFVCYDLNAVFSKTISEVSQQEIYESNLILPADSFLLTKDYTQYVKFSPYRFPFNERTNLHPDSVVSWNPNSYHAYMLAADYWYDQKQYAKAKEWYEMGLEKEVATVQEREYMVKKLQYCNNKLK